ALNFPVSLITLGRTSLPTHCTRKGVCKTLAPLSPNPCTSAKCVPPLVQRMEGRVVQRHSPFWSLPSPTLMTALSQHLPAPSSLQPALKARRPHRLPALTHNHWLC
ncbi:Hypothetical predicted protein, partial [Podarcis lilfordi]